MDPIRRANLAEVAQQLLQQSRLSAAQMASRLDLALSADYWRSLNSRFSIDSSGAVGAASAPQRFQSLAQEFSRTGYFQVNELLTVDVIAPLHDGLVKVRAHDWPAVFAYVYDEFWLAARREPVRSLLHALLGSDFQQNCHIWGHYVPVHDGAAGWRPHIDNPRSPGRVTIWIALTEATLDNGCMYVVPKHRTPREFDAELRSAQAVDKQILIELLQNCRALPAPAGAVLGWNSGVIHWGSACHGQGGPRLAISQEFFAADSAPIATELPIFEGCGGLPTFTQRLQVIAKAVLAYQRFEPLLIRYAEFASELQKQVAAKS